MTGNHSIAAARKHMTSTSIDFPAQVINPFDGATPDWWGKPTRRLGARASIIFDAFVSAGVIDGWPRSVISRVETSQGEPVAESEFMRISQISRPPADLDVQRFNARHLAGEYVYLGWLIGHYGHFVTESISRLWYCLESRCPRQFLVHSNFRSFSELPAHVVSVLSKFGIYAENLKLVRSPVTADALHCPAPAIRCDDSAGPHFKRIAERISEKSARDDRPLEKIYVSRESLKDDARQFNEKDIRGVFERFGFKSINPEALSFDEQISLYANCSHLAGPVGSGMHNAMFMPKGGKALIVAPNSFLFRNDCLLAAASGYSLEYFLVDNGPSAQVAQKPWRVSTPSLAESVRSWMSR